MAIKHPNELNFGEKKFSMIIYGSPGTGKTTLALSAPNPVLFDFDHGISRVKAAHRKDTAICSTYEEVLQDIRSAEMRNYDTIVIDTGGSFVTLLKDWAFRTRPGCRTKTGEFNGMKGFGEVKTEFARFTEELKTILNKNIIFVFHSVEANDKDGNPIQRLMCEGSAKNTVWTPCDFGGYVQMLGSKRDICFTPEQEFFAKGCHGIQGHRLVPTLTDDTPNDFLTKLFAEAKANITAEQEANAPEKEKYDAVMAQIREIVDGITDLEGANAALAAIPKLDHALTSKKEASSMLTKKCKSLGFFYDKVAKAYFVKEG